MNNLYGVGILFLIILTSLTKLQMARRNVLVVRFALSCISNHTPTIPSMQPCLKRLRETSTGRVGTNMMILSSVIVYETAAVPGCLACVLFGF